MIPRDGAVLDLACGCGRHARLLVRLGHPVVCVDIDLSGITDLDGNPRIERQRCDLEAGGDYPFADRRFAAVVVTNYLHRPIMPAIIDSVDDGGLLIYETFAQGNELFGRPRNPDHLLRPGELLDAVRGQLRVLAYEDLIVDHPRPAAIQRIAARREANRTERSPEREQQ